MKKDKNTTPGRVRAAGLLKAAAVAVLLLIGGGWTYCSYYSPGSPPGDGKRKTLFEVSRGQGSVAVVRNLTNEKLIRSARYFNMLLRLTGRSGKIKAGTYELNDGMSAGEIADVLTLGRVRMINVRVPEGWNNKQIANALVRKGLVKTPEEFLDIAKDPAELSKFGLVGATSEGYLFPDTYSVPFGFPPRKMHELMIKRFFLQLKKAGAPDGISRQDLHQRVILASIVEREAVRASERPVMAQVFLNRLEKGMKLESCATVQYLLKKPRERLLFRDLEIQSPYNTYINKGFPPGPISNPGLAALKAAFQPKESPYLFFVLKPDRSHHFSMTYSEHLAAKKRFLGN